MSVQLPFIAQPFIDPATGRISVPWYQALQGLSTTVTGALVSSVNLAGNNGITVAGGPITSSGVITLGIGNLTCANARVAGTVTAANVIATASISAANIAASGTINTANEIATGTVTAANVVATGAVQTVNLTVSTITAVNVVVASTITSSAVVSTATIGAVNIAATGTVTGASVIVTGTLTAANGVVTGTTFQSATAGSADLGVASTGWKRLYIDYTNTATVGNVTINKAAGRVNMGAGLGLVSVTNNLVTPNSHIFLNADSAPGNLVAVQFFAVSVTGAFVINAVPVVTNQTAIDFFVVNAD